MSEKGSRKREEEEWKRGRSGRTLTGSRKNRDRGIDEMGLRVRLRRR